MGNSYSHLTNSSGLGDAKFWQQYIKAGSWRSDRARELDYLGGLSREPLARGQSLDAKLAYLGTAVAEQAQEITEVLFPEESKPKRASQPGIPAFKPPTDQLPSSQSARLPKDALKNPGWGAGAEAQMERQRALERRKALMQYGQKLSEEFGTRPVSRSGTLPAGSGSAAVRAAAASAVSASAKISVAAARAARDTPAAWRVRMYAARRRVLLTVLAAVRFKLCVVAPGRLRRVDSFSIYVGKALGDVGPRFIQEQQKAMALRAEADAMKLMLSGSDQLLSIQGSAMSIMGEEGHHHYEYITSDGRTVTSCSEVPAAMLPAEGSEEDQLGDHQQQRQIKRAGDEDVLILDEIDSTQGSFSAGPGPSPLSSGLVSPVSPWGSRAGGGGGRPASSGLYGSVSVTSPLTSPLLTRGSKGPASFTAGTLRPRLSQDPSGMGGDTQTRREVLLQGLPRGMSATGEGVGAVMRGGSASGALLPGRLSGDQVGLQGGAGGGPGITRLSPRSSHSGPLSPTPPPPRHTEPLSLPSHESCDSGRPSPTHPNPPLLSPSRTTPSRGSPSTALTRSARPSLDLGVPTASFSGAITRPGSSASQVVLASGASYTSGKGRRTTEASAEALTTLLAALEKVPQEQQHKWLKDHLGIKADALKQSDLMLKMFINRSNAKWAESQGPSWLPPTPWDTRAALTTLGHTEVDTAVAQAVAALKAGEVAVQLFCAGEEVQLPDGRVADLWAVDPWRLVEAARPGCLPPTDRVEGVPLGTRVLMQLLASVAHLAGPEAAARLTLLIHCSDSQQGEVLSDLWSRRHYGLAPENVIIMPQPAWPGHRFDKAGQRWVRDALGPYHSLGTGYGTFQLSWVGAGFTLSSEGALTPLPSSVVETLDARGVKWLVSHRLRDLTLLSTEGSLDVRGLAHLLLLHRLSRANMAVWCCETDSLVVSRQYDSVLLARPEALGSASATPTQQQTTVTITSRSGRTPAPKAKVLEAGPLGVAPLAELRHSELVSPALTAQLAAVRQAAGSRLAVGTHRYAFHLPSLKGLLVGFPFRARLALTGGGSTSGSSTPPDPRAPPPRSFTAAPAALTETPSFSRPPSSSGIGLGASANGGGASGEPAASTGGSAGGGELVAVTWDLVDLMVLPAARCVPLRAEYHLHQHQQPGGAVVPRPPAGSPAINPRLSGGRASTALGPRSGASATSPTGTTQDSGLGQPPQVQPLPPALLSLDDVPAMVAPLQRQDHDVRFRRLLAEYQNARRAVHVVPGGLDLQAEAARGQTLVVLITSQSPLSDTAVAMATAVARPGRDTLVLVTVVSSAGGVEEGEALLHHYYLACLRSMVATRLEVLVRHPWGLLDVLEWYTVMNEVGLVVMATSSLTSGGDLGGPGVQGSITLAAVKRLSVPVLVVTPNTRKFVMGSEVGTSTSRAAIAEHSGKPVSKVLTPDSGASGAQHKAGSVASVLKPSPAEEAVTAATTLGGLRLLAVAERYSRPLLRYMCARCLDTGRGDKLMIGQVVPGKAFVSAQQRRNFKSALDAFESVCAAARIPVAKRLQVFGPSDRALSRAVEEEGVHLLGVQLPPGQGRIPRQVLQLIRSSKAGVLLYKDASSAL